MGILDGLGQPVANFSVDGSPNQTYTAPAPIDVAMHNITFFATQGLQLGTHTLLVTNVNETSPNICWLDDFLADLQATPHLPSTSELHSAFYKQYRYFNLFFPAYGIRSVCFTHQFTVLVSINAQNFTGF